MGNTKKLDSLLTPDVVRLFDLLFRHQAYLEGVKTGLAGNYIPVLHSLYREFAVYFAQMRYTRMDSFTLGELNQFVRLFELAQTRFYSQYTQKLIELLKEFVAVDTRVVTAIYQDVTGKLPTELKKLPQTISPSQYALLSKAEQNAYEVSGVQYDLTPEAERQQKAVPIYGAESVSGTEQGTTLLWEQANNEPIPANGYLIEPYINAFVASSVLAVTSLLRQGYANGWTTQQTFDQIVGSKDGLMRDGLFARLASRNQSMINTIIQHLNATVQAGIASAFYSLYRWVSILDDKTTEVCESRNGNIYIFGEGPLPPAHYNCRSGILPVTSNADFEIPQTYLQWLSNQAKKFKFDVQATKSLTIPEFENKIQFILGRD